nr:hypothetical protein [Tanacetum cinerariifolium]
MGYNISPNQKFTFQKGQFSHQWKYLIHTIMQCLSPKSTWFNEFSSNIATALVCLATNRVYNFSKMIFDDEPVSLLRDVIQGEACPTISSLDVKQDRANIAKASTLPHESTSRVSSLDVDEGSLQLRIQELTDLCTSLQRKQSYLVSKFEAQELEIIMLKARVKLLEDKEGGVTERSRDDAPIKGGATVLSSGVAEVPTGSGFIPTTGPPAAEIPTGSDMVPTATPIFATATVLEEEMEREAQRMNEQIDRDAEIARIHAEEELQIMIDRLDRVMKQYQDNYAKVHKYQSQQRKPLTKKKQREFYTSVLRNQAGWKAKDFKGMTLEEIKENIDPVWKQIHDFIPTGSKEEAERFKRKEIRFEQESVKKLKTSEEVPEEVKSSEEVPKEKLKEMMQLVPVEEGRIVRYKMYKAFPLPVMEFPLPEEVPTACEESSHCQKKRDATAVKIRTATKFKNNNLFQGVNLCTSASGSQPQGNTKKDRTQQTQSRAKKNKLEDHPRIVRPSLQNKKSVFNTKAISSVPNSKLNVNYNLKCATCNGCLFSDNHDSCVLEFIKFVNARVKSKSAKKPVKKKIWKPTRKMFTTIGHIWRPTGWTFILVGNVCPLTRITTTAIVPLRKPIPIESNTSKPVVTLVYSRKSKAAKKKVPVSNSKINKSLVVQIVLWYLDSGCSKHMTGDRSQLINFVSKFLGTVKFRNDHVAKIMGYGDYKIGNVTILRVYFVEGLGHNLFSVGISHETSVARSSHQNEAVATVCYAQNRSIIQLHNEKTPYELLHNKLHDLSFLHVFGALCYLTNDSENFRKLQPKADIRIFIGYTPTKKAFWIYNKRTRRIVETIHVDFDELTAMASEQSSSGPVLNKMTHATISSGLMQKPSSSAPYVPPSRNDWDFLFQPMFDELLNPPPSVDPQAPEVIASIADVIPPEQAESTGLTSSTTVDQDAPSPSKSQTIPETQSSVIPEDVEKDINDIEVAHMGSDSLFSVPIPEVTSA